MASPSEIFNPRKRASARAALGDQYSENPHPNPPLPPVLQSPNDLTDNRLRLAVNYADQRLRSQREVTPLTQRALEMYMETAIDALCHRPNGDDQLNAATTIRSFEAEFRSKAALNPVVSDEQNQFQTKLLELKALEFHARYGDYLARICGILKYEVRYQQTAQSTELAKLYWTQIQGALRKEQEAWKRFSIMPDGEPGKPDASQVATHLTMERACNNIPLQFDDALRVIYLYAERNSLVHLEVEQMVDEGRWPDLANALHQDLKALPALIPPTFNSDIPVYEACIKSLIDEYFDVVDIDLPGTYIFKNSARQMWEQNQKDKARKADKAAEIRKKVAEKATKFFNDRVKERVTILQLAQERSRSGGIPPGSPSKRKASQEHPDSNQRYTPGEIIQCRADKFEAFQKIVKIQLQWQSAWDALENNFGILTADALEELAEKFLPPKPAPSPPPPRSPLAPMSPQGRGRGRGIGSPPTPPFPVPMSPPGRGRGRGSGPPQSPPMPMSPTGRGRGRGNGPPPGGGRGRETGHDLHDLTLEPYRRRDGSHIWRPSRTDPRSVEESK